MTSNFFDYTCDTCGEPFCERVNIMNLALGFVEDAFCLNCLAQTHNQTEEDMAAFCWDYVKTRDCFKAPWLKFNASVCPKISNKHCYCQHA